MKNYDIKQLVSEIPFDDFFIGYQKGKVVLTNREIAALEKNHIPYRECSTMGELFSYIEEVLSEEDDDELEEMAKEISDRYYYWYTKK